MMRTGEQQARVDERADADADADADTATNTAKHHSIPSQVERVKEIEHERATFLRFISTSSFFLQKKEQ